MLSDSLEDYLEAIFFIVEKKHAVRAKDIAQRLNVSASSVTGALHALSDKGLINYAPYDVITLTDNGVRTAKDIVRRHKAIQNFFVHVLAVEPREANEAACKMEHSIPQGILERLTRFIDFLEACPRGGPDMLKRFRDCCEHGARPRECEACIEACLDRVRSSDE